jgi:hypothetical protein
VGDEDVEGDGEAEGEAEGEERDGDGEGDACSHALAWPGSTVTRKPAGAVRLGLGVGVLVDVDVLEGVGVWARAGPEAKTVASTSALANATAHLVPARRSPERCGRAPFKRRSLSLDRGDFKPPDPSSVRGIGGLGDSFGRAI